jgi:hypothetical protein
VPRRRSSRKAQGRAVVQPESRKGREHCRLRVIDCRRRVWPLSSSPRGGDGVSTATAAHTELHRFQLGVWEKGGLVGMAT